MIKGSCACGGIRFEIEAVRSLTHCHCTICRKLTGASFATYAHVEATKFRWLAGEDLITSYESAPGSLRAGLLDDDPGVRPRLHVFTSSKAPWWEINDDLPQYSKWVPGYEPNRPS